MNNQVSIKAIAQYYIQRLTLDMPGEEFYKKGKLIVSSTNMYMFSFFRFYGYIFWHLWFSLSFLSCIFSYYYIWSFSCYYIIFKMRIILLLLSIWMNSIFLNYCKPLILPLLGIFLLKGLCNNICSFINLIMKATFSEVFFIILPLIL